MGKKGKTSVGRAVLKDRSKGGNLGKGKESWLHTSELNDGEELNTKSVTEQSALDEFLATAELAGTEFVAEKLNISICNADHSGGLPSRTEEQRIQELQDQHRQFLQIPRRPKWDEKTTPDQLDQLEKDNFLAWRRALAELQAKDDLILTPFERNLEFWRQLWRVIERSDVVMQIVDARNPLLFRCEDLESYVTEVNSHKVNVLLINKADFLTQQQRETWANYFKSINVKAVFWSAVFETERLKQMNNFEKDEALLLQRDVVAEKPEAVLTDSHVTQFLNLQEDPDSIEVNDPTSTEIHELEFDDHSDRMRNRSLEGDDIKPDHTELFKSDKIENNGTHSVDPTRNWSAESEPKESSAMKYDTTRSSPVESDPVVGDDPKGSKTIKNDAIESENVDNTAKGGTDDQEVPSNDTLRTSNDKQTEQTASSDSPSDVPEIDQLNLLSQDCRESASVNQDSGAGSSGGINGRKIVQSLDRMDNDDGLTTNKPSNFDALSDGRTSGKPEKDAGTVYIAGKNVEFYTSGHLLTGEEILAYCQWLHHEYGGRVETGKEDKEQQTVIGLVGYPNVGKSSTINAILQAKKVPVSSTPGRTKHFQTLLVDKRICLCDCPGLVFPSFVSTKAEMVISGILPIDQLRDHVPPVALVCRRIPRDVLDTVYGINLGKPEEWEKPDRPPYAEELLDAYSHSRGFLTRQGRSDSPRSSRYILKDYVNGKLLYCHPPPTIEPQDFQMSFTTDVKTVKKRPLTNSKPGNETHVNKMDSEFFKQKDVKFHTSATTGTEQYRKLMEASQSDPNMVIVGKPWKKHGNRNKKEKLRRLKPNGY